MKWENPRHPEDKEIMSDAGLLIYCTKTPAIRKALIWKTAFERKDFIVRMCKFLGWDGGTIHQVVEEIERRADKRTFSNV